MLRVRPAPPDLADWIEAAIAVDLGPRPGVSRFPAMPQAMLAMQLAWPSVDEGGPSACVSQPVGQRAQGWLSVPPRLHTLATRPVAYSHAGPTTALGLLVRPEAAACLLGQAGAVAVDQVYDWAQLAGAVATSRIEDAVACGASEPRLLDLLADSFRRAMAAAAREGRDRTLARFCAATGRLGAQAAGELGLGVRHLERRSRALLGLSPKGFQQLHRFHRTLGQALGAAPPPLAELAVEAGYYDQSHLAREVRRLGGEPLSRLQAQARGQLRGDMPWWSLAVRRAAPSLHHR